MVWIAVCSLLHPTLYICKVYIALTFKTTLEENSEQF